MSILNVLLILILAPSLQGIINRIKAIVAGRKGPPIAQLYFDLYKLLKKGNIYSRTTTWLFRLSPIVSLIGIIIVMLFIPFAREKSCISFSGDIILIAYLFGLMRFITVLAALDTGSSFEGMGASREVAFAAFVEPSVFLCFASLVTKTGKFSLSEIYTSLTIQHWSSSYYFLILIGIVLFIILLVENCRIPVDDPNTHLELTMIHEVIILDYSSSDFAYILYSSSLKLWVYGSLLLGLLLPKVSIWWLNETYYLLGLIELAIVIGIIESVMARFRFSQIFTLLLLAIAISSFSFLLLMR